MGIIDKSDLLAAVDEDGINLMARHIARLRPALFNHQIRYLQSHPGLPSPFPEHAVVVTNHFNSLFGLENPIPVFGAGAPPVGNRVSS